MPIQAHSKAIWRESPNAGGVLDVVPLYLRYDGADVVFTTERPEQLAFMSLGGDYVLVDLVPGFLAADGADITVSTTGPAAALLADGGSGDVDVTTTLTSAPVADLLYDTDGNPWVVRRDADRLDAVLVAGNIQLY